MNAPFKHVVLAEDDAEDVELFQFALEEVCSDVELSVAGNGIELLHLLEKIPVPDVIVLDINMPIKSGKECLAEIRSKKIFDKVPVIIMSTSNSQHDIDYCLANGADKYLIKPADLTELKKMVENICEGMKHLTKS